MVIIRVECNGHANLPHPFRSEEKEGSYQGKEGAEAYQNHAGGEWTGGQYKGNGLTDREPQIESICQFLKL